MKVLHLKNVFLFTLIILAVLSLPSSKALAQTSPKATDLPDDITFWSDYPDDVLAEALVSRMSDEELFAQILMFGWAGAEPSELLNRWVVERGLGSVKVFGWNTDNTDKVAESIAFLQKESQGRKYQIPLFVATDRKSVV